MDGIAEVLMAMVEKYTVFEFAVLAGGFVAVYFWVTTAKAAAREPAPSLKMDPGAKVVMEAAIKSAVQVLSDRADARARELESHINRVEVTVNNIKIDTSVLKERS